MNQLAFEFEMTNEERTVFRLLRSGRASALSVKAIEIETGLDGKSVRKIVRDLIMEHGILIGSSVGDPPGYYLPETPDEAITATKTLRHRGVAILARAARLQRCSIELVFGQALLEFNEGERGGSHAEGLL